MRNETPSLARGRTAVLAALCAGLLVAGASTPASAAAPQPGPPLTIQRASGEIVLDGDIADAGWDGVPEIVQWFETNVGDNVEPQVRNVARLAYDDRYLYASFRFEDPQPGLIRAPLGDHDNVPSTTDYAGVIVDSRNDSKTALMFLSNPSGVQYDALSSDVTGEDNSPDYYWDSAGRITATGWTLELRIPFSTLRYSSDSLPTFGILLYRNYPRDRRYQFFSARLPRDVSCFICNSSKMTGLAELPKGSHLVVAPFATAGRSDIPPGGPGTPLENGDIEPHAGVDIKWSPLADIAIDATVKPDFSQVESDAAQIGANERFALFYPEKRSFFLEGVDLFSTPFTAVYTRTITSPSVGLRGTGRVGNTAFTVLATHDDGGGLVILPGPQGSDAALQDFESNVSILRMRRDIGQSFVSALGTTRVVEGGGHNTVFGPDFQWKPKPTDQVTGQVLWSETRTPDRPDLATQWDGSTLSDHAALLRYSHNTAHYDLFIQGQDIGPDFRADNGFIPQVGYSEAYFETGYTIRPKDTFLSRVRFFTIDYYDAETSGDKLAQRISVGSGMDGRLNSFIRLELNLDDVRVGEEILQRFRPRIYAEASPGSFLNFVSVDAYVGEEIDFANAREGHGTTLFTNFTLRPSKHLELRNDASGRWLNVDAGGGNSGRLFSAGVERLRGTWSFNARSFVRLIGQYVVTTRDTSLYTFPIAPKDAAFSFSGLFAYKVNFQTVFYLGYGDERAYIESTGELEHSGREVFAKISYAWQR